MHTHANAWGREGGDIPSGKRCRDRAARQGSGFTCQRVAPDRTSGNAAGASPRPLGCPATGPAPPSSPGPAARHPGPRILPGATERVLTFLKIRRKHEHSRPLVSGGSGSRRPRGAQTPRLRESLTRNSARGCGFRIRRFAPSSHGQLNLRMRNPRPRRARLCPRAECIMSADWITCIFLPPDRNVLRHLVE